MELLPVGDQPGQIPKLSPEDFKSVQAKVIYWVQRLSELDGASIINIKHREFNDGTSETDVEIVYGKKRKPLKRQNPDESVAKN